MPQQFKVTKDEAAILADLLMDHKYHYSDSQYTREDSKRVYGALTDLQNRLSNFSLDKRLHSRRKLWTFQDRLMKLVRLFEAKTPIK